MEVSTRITMHEYETLTSIDTSCTEMQTLEHSSWLPVQRGSTFMKITSKKDFKNSKYMCRSSIEILFKMSWNIFLTILEQSFSPYKLHLEVTLTLRVSVTPDPQGWPWGHPWILFKIWINYGLGWTLIVRGIPPITPTHNLLWFKP